jgi:DNA-binding winged helix-turn-helix (wHTH) protein
VAARSFVFGHHVLDGATGRLTRRGQPVDLQEQPSQLLLLLIERANTVVTRDEIRARLWPNTVVEYDQGINYAVRHLRVALGDAGHLLQTVPRRGYRFTGRVQSKSISQSILPERAAVVLGLTTAFALMFSAGILASHTNMGAFMYEHLVHPDHCPYIRLLVAVVRAS